MGTSTFTTLFCPTTAKLAAETGEPLDKNTTIIALKETTFTEFWVEYIFFINPPPNRIQHHYNTQNSYS